MKIIIGLGNPGKKYQNTRHNVGFMVVDEIVKQAQSSKFKARFSSKARKLATKVASNYNLKLKTNKNLKSEICEIFVSGKKVILAKPLTFMNNAGLAVNKLITNYKLPITDLYIIHDDLDIPLGKFKIQFAKGPKEHKGIESIEKTLKTKNFWRVRVGIENRNFQERISGEEYVLQEFSKEEKKIIDQVILEVGGEIKKRILPIYGPNSTIFGKKFW